jgi:hypothetical protein
MSLAKFAQAGFKPDLHLPGIWDCTWPGLFLKLLRLFHVFTFFCQFRLFVLSSLSFFPSFPVCGGAGD